MFLYDERRWWFANHHQICFNYASVFLLIRAIRRAAVWVAVFYMKG